MVDFFLCSGLSPFSVRRAGLILAIFQLSTSFTDRTICGGLIGSFFTLSLFLFSHARKFRALLSSSSPIMGVGFRPKKVGELVILIHVLLFPFLRHVGVLLTFMDCA